MRRRNFGKLLIAGSALGSVGYPDVAFSSSRRKTPLPDGLDYYNRVVEVWNRASGAELSYIIQAADAASSCLKNGGKLYSNAFTGHMLSGDLRNGRAGNPDYINTRGIGANEEQIGAGDFILFDTMNTGIKSSHDRGAFCVGVVVPYRKSRVYPSGVHGAHVLESQGGLEHEDVADVMINLGLPFTNGVLYYPEIPAVRACPASVQASGNLYWMLSAELAYRDKTGKGTGKADYAVRYLCTIRQRGARMRKDNSKYNEIAKAMTSLIADGGRYWSFSGGEGCRMFSENTGRASGIAMARTLNQKSLADVKQGDFVVFGGEHSDVRENYEMAQAVREKGAKVIWIGPSRTEGSMGNDITGLADWTIDTYSPERYGVVSVQGFEHPVCPATGILYALGLWMLNANFLARMIEADMIPILRMGIHLLGGREYNAATTPTLTERGF